MPQTEITQAILEEAKEEINKPYSTGRKIKGWVRNKLQGGIRTAFGGSSDLKSRAKEVGRNVVTVVPKLLSSLAGKIPVVGSVVSFGVDLGGPIAAKKVTDRIDKTRKLELRAKQYKGILTVQEMTELIQKEGDMALGPDTIGKMHDAVRKVDQAYTEARKAILEANDCDSMYKAAKAYYYLQYRVLRLNMYLALIQAHVEQVQEAVDRYSAQVIGFQFDLSDAMDEFFRSVDASYHVKNCKKADHCYYQKHGILS